MTRGLDAKGNVANFVETELIATTPESIAAFTQIRVWIKRVEF